MSVALIGLTSFQVYWINNAIKLNKEAFNETVLSSLRQVVSNLERKEVAKAASTSLIAIYSDEEFQKKSKTFLWEYSDSIPSHFQHSELLSDSTRKLTQSSSVEILLKNKDSVQGDSNTFKFISKSKMVNVVIDQLVSPDDIHERINTTELDSLLKQALISNGIDISYHFAVWNQDTDTIVSTNATNSLDKLRESDLKAALFPSDFISNANFLLLNFPDEKSYLYSQIWTTLTASVLFILIIVSCFSYAIYIIFKQKKLSEMKTDFINNMTHEFKTPIATVGLAVEALNETEMRNNESTLLRYLGMIREENNRLSVQVEKVLQSAILEKDSFTLKFEELHLNDVVKKMVDKYTLNLESSKGKIELDLSAQNDIIHGDEHHLSNVVLNLLDNAIKYAKAAPEITISTVDKKDGLSLTVKDNGIGISTEAQKYIFDKFYRVHTGDRHDVKGFGLGLSYVKTIVDKHGGVISVSSEINKGSKFNLTFPNGKSE